jgi:hypothetical protein
MSVFLNQKLGQVVWRLNVEDARALAEFLADNLPPGDLAHADVKELLAAVDRAVATCQLCGGEGCEHGRGNCQMAYAGPESHRTCRQCGGKGRYPDPMTHADPSPAP